MNINLPPRGGEEARAVLTTLTSMLKHHNNPLACLGFETGHGVPLPTLEQIETHVESARAILFDLCEGIDQFNVYDAALKEVQSRAIGLAYDNMQFVAESGIHPPEEPSQEKNV